jgi:hypothetical protein
MRGLSKSIGGRRAWAHLLARAGHRRSCTQQHPKQNANVAPTVHLFGLPHAWTAVPLRSRRGLSDSIRITCTSLVSTNCTIPSHHQLANQTDSTYPRASNSYQSLLASAFDSVLPFNFPHLPQPGKISSLIRKTPRQSRLIVITCPLTTSRRDPVSSSSLLSACLNRSADQNKGPYIARFRYVTSHLVLRQSRLPAFNLLLPSASLSPLLLLSTHPRYLTHHLTTPQICF